MRLTLFIVSVLMMIATVFYILHKKKNASINRDERITKIHISKTVIDIGDRIINSSAAGKFVIYNDGQNDLTIKSVEPDCHCTVGEYSKHLIKPKDSAIISLKYDSSILGDFQSSAFVKTNSDQSPLLIVLRGRIIDTLGN
ncbi:MAG: DUF1573 domain-containing protein [Sediminibacterium sp.]|nr:DUF1573 domain-containing protein [Sediminibacterium sp.]